MAVKELLGTLFGKLVVVGRANNAKDGTAVWHCLCECGETREISGTSLRAGRNKSCGCSSPRFTKDRLTTHGQSKTRTYRIWQNMRRRCSPSAKGKERRLYFEKGIRVCERWENFENFLEDMGHAPPGFSIDRKNGCGNYEQSNCRWATTEQQANNTSANLLLSHAGKTQSLSMWAKEVGVKQNTLLYRIRRGMPIARALQNKIVYTSTVKAKEREKACAVCGKLFIPRTSQIARGSGNHCSRQCSGISRRGRADGKHHNQAPI